MPAVGVFYHNDNSNNRRTLAQAQKHPRGTESEQWTQAEQLGVASHTRLSPYLELCCLRVSANASYAHTEKDVEMFTEIALCHANPDQVPKSYGLE